MSDKVFTKKMTLSICLIILCLCALSISAGAFFSDTSKSNAKTFSTATYDLTITATKQVTTVDDSDPLNVTVTPDVAVAPTTEDKHIYVLTVLPNDDKDAGYAVDIRIKDGITATSSGYCKIVIKNDTGDVLKTLYSKPIARGTFENGAEIQNFRKITIKTDREIRVEFIPLWGTYSGSGGAAINPNAVINVLSSGDVTVE